MLTRKGALFESIIVDSQARHEEMVARSGRDSVPQIFIGETHVGGCDDLHELDHEGRLDQMLAGDLRIRPGLPIPAFRPRKFGSSCNLGKRPV